MGALVFIAPPPSVRRAGKEDHRHHLEALPVKPKSGAKPLTARNCNIFRLRSEMAEMSRGS
jgi:hypothetical protein